MKKVLIISYFYNNQTIGSVRPRGLTRHLPSFGWQPIVLASETDFASCSDSGIVKVANSSVRYALRRKITETGVQPTEAGVPILPTGIKRRIGALAVRLWDEAFSYPDSTAGWWGSIRKTALSEILNTEADAIISTSRPFMSHIVAQRLAELTGVPWIADYRDLWSMSHYYELSPARRLVDNHVELQTTERAAAISTVSEPFAVELRRMHPNKAVWSIPNGIPFETPEQAENLTKEFSIMYTGQLYKGKRNPKTLFRAVKHLVDQGCILPSDITIDFYGPDSRSVLSLAEQVGVGEVVHSHSPVPRREALALQRTAHVLLMLTGDNPMESGVYTGKLFDYLAARRPVLSFGRRDSVIGVLLERTGSGRHVSTLEETVEALTGMYSEFRSRGSPIFRGISHEIDKHSQREMTGRFAELLESIS